MPALNPDLAPRNYDKTNLVFFPEPTIEDLMHQRQMVQDLREEAEIAFVRTKDHNDWVKAKTLSQRDKDLYRRIVALEKHRVLEALKDV